MPNTYKTDSFIGTRAAVFTFLTNFAGLFLGWLLYAFLARVLGPKGFGQFALIYAIFAITTSIFSSGIALATTRSAAIFDNEKSVLFSAFRIEICIDIIIYITYFILLDFICNILMIQELKSYIFLIGLVILPKGITSIINAFLKGKLRFADSFKISLVYEVTKVLLCVVLVKIGFGLRGVVVGLISAELITCVVSLLYVRDVQYKGSSNAFKVLLRMSLPLWLFNISAFLLGKIDIFCIKYLLADYKLVGFYEAAYKIADIFALFLSIAYVSLLPVLSSALKGKDYEYAWIALRRSVRYSFLLGAPLCVWIMTNSNHIMTMIFSSSFSIGGSALSIITLGRFLLSFFIIFGYILIAQEILWPSLFFNILVIPVNLILNFILIPKWGIDGAAIATLISLIGVNSLLIIYVSRRNIFPIKKIEWLSLNTIGRVLFILIILVIIQQSLFVASNSFIFIIKTSVIGFIYWLFLLILKEINQEDKKLIFALLKLKFHSSQ